MTDPQQHYHLSWHEFHEDTRKLAHRLLDAGPWQGIIAITRGGMVPATILARELDIKLIDTLCISSYEHDQQGDLNILKRPEGDGNGFIMVDDLVDTGATAKAARELLPKAHFVTVYAKELGKPLVDDYVRDIPQQTWLHFPWDTSLQYSHPLAK